MYYDITNPNASYDWLLEALQLEDYQLGEMYVEECQRKFKIFYERYQDIIEKIDIANLEIVAFQVTSSSDECNDIRKYGLHNLQWVLNNDTGLNRCLKESGIIFDIENKLMYIENTDYNIDYESFDDPDMLSDEEEVLEKIGHKVYFDFQINAFLFCKDIYEYSTVCKAPEFLYTLSSLNDETKRIYEKWENESKPYVVKFKLKISDIMYHTFCGDETGYEDDRWDNWSKLKKELVSKAIASAFTELEDEIAIYIKPDTVITEKNIIEYIPAEQWRKDVLKYFRKK